MKYLKIPFVLLWRMWFYVLMTVTILLISPLLLVLTSDEKYYAIFWKLIRVWSYVLVYGMGFHIKIERNKELDRQKSYIFCPNHASFMDPFVLTAITKNPIVFVGKKELVTIPIFGFFYKKVVIMVDRNSPKSRKRVFKKVKGRLKDGVSIGIFPEGLVPEEHVVLAPFKKGAFSLAIEHQIPIVPHTYYDCKRFFSWKILKGRPGVLRIKEHKLIETKGLGVKNIEKLQQKTFNLIYNNLLNDKAYMKDTNATKK